MPRSFSDWLAEQDREPEKVVRRRWKKTTDGKPVIRDDWTEEEIDRCIEHMASVIPPIRSGGPRSSGGNASEHSEAAVAILDGGSSTVETGGR